MRLCTIASQAQSEMSISSRERAASVIDEAKPGGGESVAAAGKAQRLPAGGVGKYVCNVSEHIFGDVFTKRTMGGA